MKVFMALSDISGPVLYFLIGLMGLAIGSFVNVLIYRLPLGLSVSKGFSMCPLCRTRLRWYDLLPLFSWLLLKGTCRYCRGKISFRYPGVELVNVFMYVIVWHLYGSTPLAAILYCIFVSALLAVFFIDAQHWIIPDQLSLILLVLGIILCCLQEPEPPIGLPVMERVAGCFAISLPLLLIALISRGEAMGGGDIKLMAGAGLCLGWRLAVLAFFLAVLAGCVISVGIAAWQRKRPGGKIPFGPYLALGLLCSLLFGSEILAWYKGLFF